MKAQGALMETECRLDRGSWWSSDEATSDMSEEWQAAICSSYLDWELTKPLPNSFAGRIRQRDLCGVRLIECECSPHSGRRVLRGPSKEGEPFVGIQIIESGNERFKIGPKHLAVGPRSLVFWNSFEQTEYEVRSDLRKVTLLMPQSLLESRLEIGALINGGILDTEKGIGSILYDYLQTLAAQFDAVYDDSAVGVKWASVELGACAAQRLREPLLSAPQHHLMRVQNYIIDNLQDPGLSVRGAATNTGISIRYLHYLFSIHGISASKWIMEQRLLRSKEALLARKQVRSVVKDVAFQWGFSDVAHFSRAFKSRFGDSPVEFWKKWHQQNVDDQEMED